MGGDLLGGDLEVGRYVVSTPPIYMAFDCLYLEGQQVKMPHYREGERGWEQHPG